MSSSVGPLGPVEAMVVKSLESNQSGQARLRAVLMNLENSIKKTKIELMKLEDAEQMALSELVKHRGAIPQGKLSIRTAPRTGELWIDDTGVVR